MEFIYEHWLLTIVFVAVATVALCCIIDQVGHTVNIARFPFSDGKEGD
jgi:hypothetical protein